LFILLTSNPFERLVPAAVDGADLNPLLQDFALAIHPPILYTGYVGFSVAFAFAVAALLEGRLDVRWARWTRPWTTLSWMFLTVGIALGSWWAYYELGWGGWWFWDPVENASFMPWLVGTALVHSLAVTEKRNLFQAWTLLLAIIAFSLSLLGTFLVRSGVLISVHAFANDPARGLFILIFLALCIGGSLVLFAWRGPALRNRGGFAAISRESFLLFNNVLLLTAMVVILLGCASARPRRTLNLKISVGPPYFNAMFLMPTIPLLFLMAVGMHASWKKGQLAAFRRPLVLLFVVALAIGLVVPSLAYGEFHPMTVVGVTAAAWLILSALYEPVSRWRAGQSLSRGVLGMSVASLGVGLFALVSIPQTYRVEKDLALHPGETVRLKAMTSRSRARAVEDRTTRPLSPKSP
jgi:cytochrome c-type biogenesis protein CcmF